MILVIGAILHNLHIITQNLIRSDQMDLTKVTSGMQTVRLHKKIHLVYIAHKIICRKTVAVDA